jgi:hypothetical protein
MKIILKQALVTPGNYPRIAARIVPQDQRDAIRPGIRISHYSFTNRQGQQVYIIVCHTTNRAGISWEQYLLMATFGGVCSAQTPHQRFHCRKRSAGGAWCSR